MPAKHVPARPRRSWVPCGCLLAMFFLGVIVPVLGFVGWGVRAARQVAAERARIRAAGQPVTVEELDAFYHLDPDQADTTQLWIEIGEELDGPEYSAACQDLPIVGQGAEIPPPGQDWPDRDAVAQLLSTYQSTMDKIHLAVQQGGHARFPIQFENAFSARLVHVQRLRAAARMLALEARLKAHQGDARGAARAIDATFRMNNNLKNEPVLVSQLVRIAINGSAVDLTTDLLGQIEFSEEDLVMLLETVRSIRLKDGLKKALIGERVFGQEAFRNPASVAGNGPGFVRASNEDLALYLATLRALIEATDSEFPDALDASESTMSEFRRTTGASGIARMRYIVSVLMIPATDAAFGATARVSGSNKCAEAALAIELYRRKHGALPRQLRALVPEFLDEVPRDPFDGKPLRYIINQDEYLLYTLGVNRIDDGGVDDDTNGDSVHRITIHLGPSPASAEHQESSAANQEQGPN